jgi:hypothetical protein
MRADFHRLKANPDLGFNQILSCFFGENPRPITFGFRNLLRKWADKLGSFYWSQVHNQRLINPA